MNGSVIIFEATNLISSLATCDASSKAAKERTAPPAA